MTYRYTIRRRLDPVERQERARQRDKNLQQALTASRLPPRYTMLPEAERFSDTGVAMLVEDLYGDELRHVSAWGWHVYHDGRWDGEDGKKLAERRVEDALHRVAQAAASKVGSDEGDKLYNHARASFNRVGYIAQAASRREELSARPELFDAQPNLLNVANGVVDLNNGYRHEHDPTFYLTKQARAEYHADEKDVRAAAAGDAEAMARINAGCPLFLKFMGGVFCGDTELVSYMQKALGYTLTTSTQEHALFILYGGGRNGKSSLLNVLAGVLGDYATTVKPEVLVHQGISYRGENSADPELARLPGVRLVTSVEPGDAGGKADTARVKQLTGGDPLSVRRLYHEGFTYTPAFKIFLATNKLPKIEEDTEGIWRRLKPIPFNARFEPGMEGYVADIHKVLLDKEAGGILTWLVVGALRFRQEGLGDPPKSVQALMDRYHREQQPYSGFFEDEVARDPDGEVTLDETHKRFEAWGRANMEMLREALDIPDSRNGWPVPLTLPNKTKFAVMCDAQNYPKKRRKNGFVLVGMRLRSADERRDTGGDDEEGVAGCSKTPLYTEVSMDDSYKDFCETPPFPTPSYTAPTPPPAEPPIGPRVVPVLTACYHSRLLIIGERAVCTNCKQRWARAEEVHPCPHPSRVAGRCVACNQLVERPADVGGCTHPTAEYTPGSPYVRCPLCRNVDESDRGGLHYGIFDCANPSAHRADWDGLGCPHCWTPPGGPRQVMRLPEPPAPKTAEDLGWTWDDAYALLPRCPHEAHEWHETRHLAARCTLTNLWTGKLPQKITGTHLVEMQTNDDGEVATFTARPNLPLGEAAVAALALAHGLPVAANLRAKLDEMREREGDEQRREACLHIGGRVTIPGGQGKHSWDMCVDCGADLTPGCGYV